jgi:hypothetical protein
MLVGGTIVALCVIPCVGTWCTNRCLCQPPEAKKRKAQTSAAGPDGGKDKSTKQASADPSRKGKWKDWLGSAQPAIHKVLRRGRPHQQANLVWDLSRDEMRVSVPRQDRGPGAALNSSGSEPRATSTPDIFPAEEDLSEHKSSNQVWSSPTPTQRQIVLKSHFFDADRRCGSGARGGGMDSIRTFLAVEASVRSHVALNCSPGQDLSTASPHIVSPAARVDEEDLSERSGGSPQAPGPTERQIVLNSHFNADDWHISEEQALQVYPTPGFMITRL